MTIFGFIIAQALVLGSPPTGRVEQPDIVVTGRRIEVTGKALADCIARGCSPKEEISASLAHAEAQMIAGNYPGSRTTLLKARERNRRYAKSLPVDVSDLHRANARLAVLNGLEDSGRIGVFDVVDALKAGLSRDDERIMVARLEVGDAFSKVGRYKAAELHYQAIAGHARDANMPLVEGMALFRRAALLLTMASVDPDYRYGAERAVAKITRSAETAWAPFRDAMQLVPAVLAIRNDSGRALDTVVAGMTPRAPGKPELLYAPAIDPNGIGFGAAPATDVEWVDLSFRVTPQGRVVDLAEVRVSDGLPKAWVTAVTKSLRERRYAPMNFTPGNRHAERVERFAFVGTLAASTRSRIRTRSAARRLDIMDLTAP